MWAELRVTLSSFHDDDDDDDDDDDVKAGCVCNCHCPTFKVPN
jgi:hypothetical protein